MSENESQKEWFVVNQPEKRCSTSDLNSLKFFDKNVFLTSTVLYFYVAKKNTEKYKKGLKCQTVENYNRTWGPEEFAQFARNK